MVFGHAALGSLGNQLRPVRGGLPFCLAAAYGPDWLDKPLKLFFGLSGHGIAHSLLGSLLFLALFRWLCRRWSLPAAWPLAAVLLWTLHLVCDQVRAAVLFWPVFGPFSLQPASTTRLAWNFYAAPPLSALAWCDIALTLLAITARLLPVSRPAVR